MAYPDDKETFRRVVNQELPDIPGDVLDENDQNLPADFLERLQDTLGYGIKMGYATVKAFFDYVVSQITLIAGKVNKAGDTMTGNLTLEGPTGTPTKLEFLETGKPIRCFIHGTQFAFRFEFYTTALFYSSLKSGSVMLLKNSEILIYTPLNINSQDITGVKNITCALDEGFINTKKGKGIVVKTPDGTKNYRISVDNAGNVISTLIP